MLILLPSAVCTKPSGGWCAKIDAPTGLTPRSTALIGWSLSAYNASAQRARQALSRPADRRSSLGVLSLDPLCPLADDHALLGAATLRRPAHARGWCGSNRLPPTDGRRCL